MATAFKIEKGVPLAPKFNTRGTGPKYPFGDMVVGDSFFVPAADELERGRVFRNVSSYARNPRLSWASDGQKYTVRTFPDGVRVWRVA